jgi:hypothetical protein
VGIIGNPSDPASHGYDPKTTTMKFHFRVSASPSNSYTRDDLDDDDSASEDNESGHQDISLPGWDAVLWHGRLYVIVTEKQLLGGSKEAFVSLLEYAEDTLGCQHVIVCMVSPGGTRSTQDFDFNPICDL